MQHDVDYLRPGYINALSSDVKAISRSNWDWDGLAMKVGLTTRALLDTLAMTSPLWVWTKLFRFNSPYFDDVRNDQLVEDLQNHLNNWEVI
jgi:hypothetical protein